MMPPNGFYKVRGKPALLYGGYVYDGNSCMNAEALFRPEDFRPAEDMLLQTLVADLADEIAWNWTRQGISHRDAADMVLRRMAEIGLIEHRRHRLGGNVYRCNGVLFGRLDDVTDFDALEEP